MLDKIRRVLGRPFFEAPNCVIYNRDCLEVMRHIQSPFINLTVTSPPYNIGKEYEQVLPVVDYLNWSKDWIDEVYRLTLDNGAFWLNLGYVPIKNRAKAIPLPYLLWELIHFFLVQEIVWNYGAGVAGRRFYSPRNEKFLWYVKDESNYTFNLNDVRDPNIKYPNQKKNGKIKVNLNGKNPSDVWQIPKVTSGKNRSSKERTSHPAQFPQAVIERIIKASSNLGEVVFDPFMGSGTTALVALGLGRRVLGFEINSDYCQIAASRLDTYFRKSITAGKQLELLGESFVKWESK
ncbi:MAG: site-specific DNA-methyltransferase [Nitrososphaera sp.]|nr:site-specific DNA-methyltransferase [Nitrososphaera sp.]